MAECFAPVPYLWYYFCRLNLPLTHEDGELSSGRYTTLYSFAGPPKWPQQEVADKSRNPGAYSPSATEEKAPVTEEEKEATAASHTAAASHVMSNLTWSPARQRHIHLFAAFTVTGAGLPIPSRHGRDLARFLLHQRWSEKPSSARPSQWA